MEDKTKGRRFSVAGGQGGRRGSILIPDKVYRVSTCIKSQLDYIFNSESAMSLMQLLIHTNFVWSKVLANYLDPLQIESNGSYLIIPYS